jgi:hypothetical protein
MSKKPSGYEASGYEENTVERRSDAESVEASDDYTPLQAHYLRDLEHRISVKARYEADPKREEWLLKVINLSAYAAYRACLDNGTEAEARQLVEAVRESE